MNLGNFNEMSNNSSESSPSFPSTSTGNGENSTSNSGMNVVSSSIENGENSTPIMHNSSTSNSGVNQEFQFRTKRQTTKWLTDIFKRFYPYLTRTQIEAALIMADNNVSEAMYLISMKNHYQHALRMEYHRTALSTLHGDTSTATTLSVDNLSFTTGTTTANVWVSNENSTALPPEEQPSVSMENISEVIVVDDDDQQGAPCDNNNLALEAERPARIGVVIFRKNNEYVCTLLSN